MKKDRETRVRVAGDEVGRSPSQSSSLQRSRRDERMWSALKSTLLSEAAGPSNESRQSIGSSPETTGDKGLHRCVPDSAAGPAEQASADVARMAILSDRLGIDATRDMEQLHRERSVMDRTMRLHRSASARRVGGGRKRQSHRKVSSR